MRDGVARRASVTQLRPRLGSIAYVNCAPVTWGLRHTGMTGSVDLNLDTPMALTRALLNDDLDASPVPTVEYLRNADVLVRLDDLGIVSDGPLGSISLVTKVPPGDLDGHTVAVTTASATSVALLEVLLRERWGSEPTLVAMAPVLDEMLTEADAALLIGDDALRIAAPAGMSVIDVAHEWTIMTGLPMVFAVWVARREWAAVTGDVELAAFASSLARARDAGVAALDEVARVSARDAGLPRGLVGRYLRRLRYRVDERGEAAICRFADLVGVALPDVG